MMTTADEGSSTGDGAAETMSGCEGMDCPCGGEADCSMGQVCVMGMCTPCGNGIVEGPETCDGDGELPNAACMGCVLTCNDGFADCDGMSKNGCEIELGLPTDCRECDHDCLGGECEEGECQPVNLATGQSDPLGLDVEGNYVFWTELVGPGGFGAVRSRELAPGSIPVPIATGLTSPETVVADGTHVYFGDTFGSGDVGRAAYNGDDLNLQWLEPPGTFGPRLLLSDSVHIYALLVSDPPVRASKGTSQNPQVMVGTNVAWGGFLHEDELYFADPVAGEIFRIPIAPDDGFPQLPVSVVSGQPDVVSVYIHDGRIYWTTAPENGPNDPLPGIAAGQDLDGGNLIMYGSNLSHSEDLVVDDDHIYFVERNVNGRLHRVTLDGTEVTDFGQSHSAGIDHDDTAIYWADQVNGRIRMKVK